MADPGREVKLEIDGTEYTLYGGNRALRLTERELGLPTLEAVDRMTAGDFNAMTVMMWALLQRHHPQLAVDDMDDIIDAGGYDYIMERVAKAMEKAFPQMTEDAKGKAKSGTGTKSSPVPTQPE